MQVNEERGVEASARRLLELDAGFEAGLALVLLVGAGAGWLGGADFPHPVGRTMLAAVGGALAVWAIALVALAKARRPDRTLPYVALGNDLTALAAVVWLALAQGFSTAGTVVVIGAVIGLFVLSTLQARAMLAGRHRLAAGRPR